jgi:OFA family oxalate/formate antiporter-like MFS transporter
MLYFRHNKAVASAIAILSFVMAKSVASPLYTYMTSNFAIDQVFFLLALIYTVPLIVTSFLFRKFPVNYKPPAVETINIGKTVRTLSYISIWLFFFINIACGLAFISQEAQLYSHYGVALGMATALCTLSAVFNAGGRFGFAWVSDKFGRYVPYVILFALSSLLCLVNFGVGGLGVFVVSVMLINACYGGGFSALPALLASKYGITNTSTIHSLTLSAWGIAGIASLFLKGLPVDMLFVACCICYGFNLLLLYLSKK